MKMIAFRSFHVIRGNSKGSCHKIRRYIPQSSQNQYFHSASSLNEKTGIPFYGSPRSSSDSLPSPLHRISLAINAATTAFKDPSRADAVAILGEVTGHFALRNMQEKMMSHPIGKNILQERPLVSKETLPIDSLIESSKHITENGKETFGQAYGKFLGSHKFDPDERDEVKYVSDPDLAYIMLRYRQCHDYWHTLTGLPPTVLGELGLKWLELLQTGLPVAALSATVGSLRLEERERKILNNLYFPWAVKMSKQSEYLLNVHYELEFDTPLQELRDRLRIEPAPIIHDNF